MLGIIISVAAVIVLSSIGRGMEKHIADITRRNYDTSTNL
jgi:hypothetical protein